MKVVIDNANIKFYARALVFLAKFGEEFRFRTTGDELIIEVFQLPHKMAFIQLKFEKQFFKEWEHEDPVDLKIRAKCCVAVYHNPSLLGKTVESSEIILDDTRSDAIFQHNMKYDVRKEYIIPLLASSTTEDVEFPDSENECNVHLQSTIKLIFEGLKIFGLNELVSMRIREQNIRVETGDEQEIQTKVTSNFYYDQQEFFEYNLRDNCDITFAIKVVKQFLNLFQQHREPNLHCYFTDGQSPIVFECAFPNMEARLMLAPVNREYNELPDRQSITTASVSFRGADGDFSNASDEEFDDDGMDDVMSRIDAESVITQSQSQRRTAQDIPSSADNFVVNAPRRFSDDEDDHDIPDTDNSLRSQHLGSGIPTQVDGGDDIFAEDSQDY